MTREEALKEYQREWMKDNSWNDYTKDEIVNKIYDDFESRTCVSCKHFKAERYYIDIHDKVGYPQTRCSELHINWGKDFGCNKWEARENG